MGIMNNFFKTVEEIEIWLKAMRVSAYRINEDLSIDLYRNLSLSEKDIEYLPVQFGHVKGSFFCQYNGLKSLVGSPRILNGEFHCDGNLLTTLEGSPEETCMFSATANRLVSLKGCPRRILGSFYVNENLLTEIDAQPEYIKGNFGLTQNPIRSLEGLHVDFDYNLHHDYQPTQGGFPIKNFEHCYRHFKDESFPDSTYESMLLKLNKKEIEVILLSAKLPEKKYKNRKAKI